MSPLVLAVFALTGAPAKAGADQEPSFIAVLPVEGSNLTEARSSMVRETVEAQLESDAFILVPEDHIVAAVQERGATCAGEAACLEAVAEQLRARFTVRVTVDEPKAADFEIHVEAVEPASDTVVATFDESCTICSEADLKRIVQERTLDTRLALERHLAPDDDEPVVEAPAPKPVVAAPTKVEVQVAKPSRLTTAGWGLLGAGIASTVGGVVLLGLQGSKAGCPEDPRGGPCIPLVYETVLPGAITTSVGLALFGTGVGLLVVGRKRDARRTTARIGPIPGGVQVSGRF